MAIEYSFVLNTRTPLPDIVSWLTNRCGFQPVDRATPVPTLWAEGLICYVSKKSGLGRALVQETFAIDATTDLSLVVDKFDEREAGMARLMALCEALLLDMDCDLVMLSNGEKGLVLRKDGETVFDCSDDHSREHWTAFCNSAGLSCVHCELPIM